MKIRPVVRVPAHELAVGQIRRAIHLGSFAPGDRLPPERELAKELNVSRVTLREAVEVLRAQGYLEVRRGQSGGLIVVDQQQTLSRLKRRLKSDWDRLSDIMDFRIANECAAARLAAARRSTEDLGVLRQTLEELRKGESLAEFRRADSSFHLSVADAARSPLLREAVDKGRAAMFLPSDPLSYEVIFGNSLTDHESILSAIESQNPDSASAAMQNHIETTRSELRQMLSD